MIYNNGAGQYIDIDGMLVERDALRIAEAIKEYDPNLEILCVDPDHSEGISEEPFVIAELCKDGVLRPVFRAWKLDESVLHRIRFADGQKHNALETLEAWDLQAKKERLQRYEEFRAEAKDKVAHIAGMKSKYTVRDSNTGDLITFYDDRPSTRKRSV